MFLPFAHRLGGNSGQTLDCVCPNDTDSGYARIHAAGCSGIRLQTPSVTHNLPQKSWWDLSPLPPERHQQQLWGNWEKLWKRKCLHINRFHIRQGLKSIETLAWLWTLGYNPSAAELLHSSFLLFGELMHGLSHPLNFCFAACCWKMSFRDTQMGLRAWILKDFDLRSLT